MTWFNDVASAILSLSGKSDAATSNWGSIHPDLIAEFIQVDVEGNETGVAFKALIKDGNVEQSFEWVSPFENMTAENDKMSILGMAQTGGLGSMAQILGVATDGEATGLASLTVDALEAVNKAVSGRSSITKMNSSQVYSGHAPLKIDLTLVFRAWQDPQSEVTAPFTALQRMAYPEEMAKSVADVAKDKGLSIELLFPSLAPKLVRFTYKGETYPPMVIESIGKPLDAPYSPMGDIWIEVPVSLHSFQSLDFKDIQAAKTGVLGRYISESINQTTSLFDDDYSYLF